MDPALKISALSQEQAAFCDTGRSIYHQLTGSDEAPNVAALQAIFEWCKAQDWNEERLQERAQVVALSICFGDVLCQRLPAQWIWAEDTSVDHSDVAVQIAGTEIVVWPFAMITKRILNNDNTGIENIIEGVEAALQDLKTAPKQN